MAKTKQIASSLQSFKMQGVMGINNVVPAEKCKPTELQTATNVDINIAKQVLNREGYDLKYSGNVHSLFSNGVNGNATFKLFREGALLNKLNSDYTATTLRSGIPRTNWMQYLALNNLVYYSDTIITGITDGTLAGSRSWGLVVPPPQLVLTETTGLLPSGRYLCSLTYIRDDGQESGAPRSIYIDLPTSNAGIAISNIPESTDPGVDYVYIYLSTRNGEVLYLASAIANGVSSVTYAGDTKEFSKRLTTQFMGSPHTGHMIQFYNGRIYVVKDNAVWYTLPYNYELMDLAHGFFQFPDRVTLFAPVRGGIWVSYKNGKTFFLEGTDPEKGFITNLKTDSGAHEGSQRPDEVTIKGEIIRGWYWTGNDGIYLGLDGGTLLNKTEDRYEPGSANYSVSFIKKTQDGSKQYISLLY